MDRLTPERRGWLMSRVKSRDTNLEMTVRRMVFAMGYRYRLHDRKLPGKPDLVFASRRKVLFVHGCFWHSHEHCRLSKLPSTNVAFWEAKLAANKARDSRVLGDLQQLGWESLVVWQCELATLDSVRGTIRRFLDQPPPSRIRHGAK